MRENVVGRSVPRIDAIEKVTGTAVYGADVVIHGMLYGKVLRSPYAHARIISVDTSRVWELPGVRAVVTGEDMPGVLGGEAVMDMPFLARGKVRFVGEPVAAVAAEDEETATSALSLIKVEYEELEAVIDPLEAMREGALLIHEGLDKYKHIPVVKPVPNSNIISSDEFRKGDVEKGFAESDYIFENTFRSHTVQHSPIEIHTAVVQVTADGKITIWVPNDGPHRLRKDLADALEIPQNRIRVISTLIGGGFGAKGGLKVEPVGLALAMKCKHRPVKVVLTREEMFQAMLVRHATVATIKTGVKNDGTLVACEIKTVWDTGAYAEKGPTVTRQCTAVACGPYRIPHVKSTGYCVYTNKIISGAFRGYGTPQVNWAYESQMDIIARKMGIDPVEFRLKNALCDGDENPTGQVMTGVGVKECLRQAAAAAGLDRRRDTHRDQEGYKRRGIGIACAIKNTKTPSGSAAAMYLNQDGSVNILTSTVEIGQGAKTIYAQMASEVLGIPMEKINISDPDTDFTPFDSSTTSSRSAFHMGNALIMAAEDIKRQLCEIAASLYGCSAGELEAADGKVRLKGGLESGEKSYEPVTYQEIIKKKYGAGGTILGKSFYYPEVRSSGMWSAPSVFWMYSAHAAEVEVDTQTGKVKVLRLVAAQDVGKAINPVNCEQQIEGGVLTGLGTALIEKVIFSDKGVVLNPNLHDYKIPTAVDAPVIVPILVQVPDPNGPFGAKGIGEVVVTPAMSAVANAVEDAIGVRITDLPITEEKVLAALSQLAEK